MYYRYKPEVTIRKTCETVNIICNHQKLRIGFPNFTTAGDDAWVGTTGGGEASLRAATSEV
jgi:hypothetical protein